MSRSSRGVELITGSAGGCASSVDANSGATIAIERRASVSDFATIFGISVHIDANAILAVAALGEARSARIERADATLARSRAVGEVALVPNRATVIIGRAGHARRHSIPKVTRVAGGCALARDADTCTTVGVGCRTLHALRSTVVRVDLSVDGDATSLAAVGLVSVVAGEDLARPADALRTAIGDRANLSTSSADEV